MSGSSPTPAPGRRIEDYALIGDCESAALVSREGSIDWLCWPRFDSPALFAALLGGPEHGRWLIRPRNPDARASRRYRDGSMILETTFESPDGTVVVTDFMPVRGSNADLVRIARVTRGRVEMMTDITLRFSYGAIVPWVSRVDERTLRAIAGADMVTLTTDVPLHGTGLSTHGEFALREGESAAFVLTWGPSHLDLPRPVNAEEALAGTQAFWRDWMSRCSYRGEWEGDIRRSLLTLKALTYAPTGGIVAAPTTSLPEFIGGPRNWDYRFCWLRDATFTLLALMDAGYYDEARAWRDWLVRAAAGSPEQAQIMYGLAGERHLLEWEIGWLPGFAASRPVRVGNAAHAQFQLDVFGEVLDALHQGRLGGIPEAEEAWNVQRQLAVQVERVWQSPDQGLWEVRSGAQHFTHSKVMAWVALDRAVKACEQFGLAGPVDRWREVRQQIHDDVCRRAWDAGQQTFVQAYDTPHLDASCLLMPLVGFLPVTDPRIQGTIAQIERRLVRGGFVLRYDTHKSDDGLPPGEGAFLACSFWLADAYVLQGRHAEARALFERLRGLCNDVGLLAEEYDPAAKRFLGNFPQAFSHVALVTTGLNLSRIPGAPTHPATQRSSASMPAVELDGA